MSYTQSLVTHTFRNADGTPASGSITFQLSKRMSQPGLSIAPSEITANLDSSGNLSQELYANNDPETIPQDSEWIMTMRLLGDSQTTYALSIPSGGAAIDLYSLLPQGNIGG